MQASVYYTHNEVATGCIQQYTTILTSLKIRLLTSGHDRKPLIKDNSNRTMLLQLNFEKGTFMNVKKFLNSFHTNFSILMIFFKLLRSL